MMSLLNKDGVKFSVSRDDKDEKRKNFFSRHKE